MSEAERLEVEVAHLNQLRPGPRPKWTDVELAQAVRESMSWREVQSRLQSGYGTPQRRAQELRLDVAHLSDANHLLEPTCPPLDAFRSPKRFHVAAESLASAWYAMHGFDVFVPAGQGNVVDLVAVSPDGTPRKVQVKSSQRPVGTGWVMAPTRTPTRTQRAPSAYLAEQVDEFFFVAGDLTMYRFPFSLVADKARVSVGRKYHKYQVAFDVTP